MRILIAEDELPLARVLVKIFEKNNYSADAVSCFNTTASEIKSEQLKHIFDRFYRMDSSRNSGTGGHGIGLSVVKAIVAAHGGKISAWTKDGHSFQITAVFPV